MRGLYIILYISLKTLNGPVNFSQKFLHFFKLFYQIFNYVGIQVPYKSVIMCICAVRAESSSKSVSMALNTRVFD